MKELGLHGKHCDKWLIGEGRYCDRPATVCNLGRYRCNEHDPLRVAFVGEYVAAVEQGSLGILDPEDDA